MTTLHIEIQHNPVQYIKTFPKNKSMNECIQSIVRRFGALGVMGKDIYIYTVVKKSPYNEIKPVGMATFVKGKWYWVADSPKYAHIDIE